jgi:hypothetical protein
MHELITKFAIKLSGTFRRCDLRCAQNSCAFKRHLEHWLIRAVALSRSVECEDGGACEGMGDGCKDFDIAAANALSVPLLMLLLMGRALICSTCLRGKLASSA